MVSSGILDVDAARTTNMQDNTTSYIAGEEPWNKNLDGFSIPAKTTEANLYQVDWVTWHGMYRATPEARSTLDVWCKWVIGKKLKMSPSTRKIVSRFKGNGKQTFRQILINIKRVSKICGDGFAEAPRDKAGRLMNLRVRDSGTIQIEANASGTIIKYNQVAEKNNQTTNTNLKVMASWQPDEIFHVMNDPIADEIHGIPELEKLQKIIKWKQQSMSDQSVVFHRYVQPTLDVYAKTDDEGELDNLQAVFDKSAKNFENRIIPAGSVEKVERVSIPQYSTLDPLPWLIFLRSYFTESSNVPDLIRGKSDEVSLAAGKLNYLGFKEKIIMEQLEFSEMLESQLGLKVEFEPPTEIDLEISREPQDMQNKINAKKNTVVTTGPAPKQQNPKES